MIACLCLSETKWLSVSYLSLSTSWKDFSFSCWQDDLLKSMLSDFYGDDILSFIKMSGFMSILQCSSCLSPTCHVLWVSLAFYIVLIHSFCMSLSLSERKWICLCTIFHWCQTPAYPKSLLFTSPKWMHFCMASNNEVKCYQPCLVVLTCEFLYVKTTFIIAEKI